MSMSFFYTEHIPNKPFCKPVQPKYNTNETKTREINCVFEAMEAYGLAEGSILLYGTQEHTIEEINKIIHILPVWK